MNLIKGIVLYASGVGLTAYALLLTMTTLTVGSEASSVSIVIGPGLAVFGTLVSFAGSRTILKGRSS